MVSNVRTRTILSLIGIALSIVGYLLPLFSDNTHSLYFWQAITSTSTNILAALSLLTFLIILTTSGIALFTKPAPGIVFLSGLAAAWGPVFLLTFLFSALQIRTGLIITWGFLFLLTGSLITLLSMIRHQLLLTPLTCTLCATGSLLMTLIWIFLDFFTDMIVIDPYAWLPLAVLLLMTALSMTRQWTTTALTFPLVIVALYGLFYLLKSTGSITFIPAPLIILMTTILLLLLHGCLFWLTWRIQPGGRKQIHMNKRSSLKILTGAAASLAIGGLFIKTYLWNDPSKRWLLADLFPTHSSEKLTLAPPLALQLDDASHLNSSMVAEIRSPKNVDDVIQAIQDAQSSHRSISLSGIRHSMGGQALGQQTLHLDMTQMDMLRYNASDQTITTGPGTTWRQVQTLLSQHGRAVRVMQDSNIFTVGGSLSVNAHGKDPRYGSLIEGVNFIKMVTADGQEIRCDREQQTELFTAIIGGYGLLGIITEINLQTTPNRVYSFTLHSIPTHRLIDTLESLGKDPAQCLLEAHLSVDRERFLTDSLVYQYSDTGSQQQPVDDLEGENSIWLRKIVFQASRASNMGKLLRWELEKQVSPLIEPRTVSRNTAMAVPVRFLQNPDPQNTDILQEYFVPTGQVNNFLERYKQLLQKHAIHLLNVTIRKVPEDRSALVSYAQQDMYGLVVYYKIQHNTIDVQRLDTFTRELITYLIEINATYYLCYGSHYSHAQLTAMYPDIAQLFALKTQHDPGGLFTSLWYEKYAEGFTHV